MSIKNLLPGVFITLASITGLVGQVNAASKTSDLMVFKFEESKPASIEDSADYLRQFLPREDKAELRSDETQVVRFVSEQDVNSTFEHNLVTGDVSFHADFTRYLGDFVPRLPDEEEAVELAQKFLRANKLMPVNQEELTVAHVGGLRTNTIMENGKPGPIIDKLKTVTFARELSGLPVIGAGSKFIVNVGDKGEILGVTKRWRELKASARLSAGEVISESEAKERAYEQSSREFGKNSSIEIESMQLAYFDNNNTYIQPVYAFETRIQLEDKRLEAVKYIAVIPAMRKPIENLNLTELDDTALELIQGEDGTVPSESGRGSD